MVVTKKLAIFLTCCLLPIIYVCLAFGSIGETLHHQATNELEKYLEKWIDRTAEDIEKFSENGH